MRSTTLTLFLAAFVLSALPFAAHGQDMQCNTPAEKIQCQAALTQAEADEAAAQSQLVQAQGQSASLAQEIAVLSAKIKVAQLDIKSKNLLIQSLGTDIATKQSHIDDLEDHIARGKETLSDILRKTNEMDSYSLPEIVLSQTSLTGFLQDVDSFQSVQEGLRGAFYQLQTDEASTSEQKDALNKRLTTESDARHAIQTQELAIQGDQKQQQQLLSISKGNEKSYTTLVAQKASLAAQIRAALFPLAGGGKAIPFGQAYQYALTASAKTGVRPAFLLAILTQESNLGANVGRCYLTDENTGAGINVKTGLAVTKVMSPTRDVPPFLSIIKGLGNDPYKAVVSCPQAVGWGGAMGPAQFIASTWMLLQDRVASALGTPNSTPSPWEPQTAFMAASLFLGDLGAGNGGYTAEHNAACRYYGGGSVCTSVTKPYGNSVIALADSIQTTMINPLLGQ